MALFVHVTENCEKTAKEHQLTDELDRLRQRLETTQSSCSLDRFPAPFLVKKKFGSRQGRLVAQERNIGADTVIVFLGVLIRGDRAYKDDFSQDPDLYAARHFRDSPTDQQLASVIADRIAKDAPRPKPQPSEQECAFLYNVFAPFTVGTNHMAGDDMVYESAEWVRQVGTSRIANQLALLNKPCCDALSHPEGLGSIDIAQNPGWAIWFYRMPGRLILLRISTDGMQKQQREAAEQMAAAWGDGDEKATHAIRSSRRAYQSLILADSHLWIELEKETVANMALSPEESEVLESTSRSYSGFPLFINGRAGSGKSTILQYLFARLLYSYLTSDIAGTVSPPVYLTANGDLLRRARSFVERLLRRDSSFTQEAQTVAPEDHRGTLDASFQEFEGYLLSLLPSHHRARFSRRARVDYARFRRMWTDRFGCERAALRGYGPDLSWHVIRTYIKGLSSNGYLEADEYRHLPANQRTVTSSTYETVHARVWAWYSDQLKSEQLWDDQDLARHVLDEGLVKPVHPAVVCDEAQDFTRLELEILFRLNLFSERAVPPSDIAKVPFAFAGDPFQTLNPTGFRWDAIKAAFVEKFIFEMDPARRGSAIDLNYRELQYNYRSTDTIVRFGNQVQAMRKALFNIPEIRPQTPWAHEQGSFQILWFRADDPQFWSHFTKNPGFVVIVPCNQGEEEAFVREDAFLRDHIQVVDGVPVNVLSANRAKGCEYPAVVVYGFGQNSPAPLTPALEEGETITDANMSLPLQYFINRLYVAVSRPKTRLIVVDTQHGFDSIWKSALDQELERQMLSRIKDGAEWSGQIVGMIMGDPETLNQEVATDQLANAEAFEQDGRARQDAFLLRQAAQAYRGAGKPAKAQECLARALETEGKRFEAGKEFIACNMLQPDAIRCLWRAGEHGWLQLNSEVARNTQIRSELECMWARELTGRRHEAGAAATLLDKFLLRFAHDPAFRDDCLSDSVWEDAIAQLLDPLFTSGEKPPRPGDAQRIAAQIDRLAEAGLTIAPESCAGAYYAAGRLADAVAAWENAAGEKPAHYHRARVKLEPYPDRLLSLYRLDEFTEIIQAYESQPAVPLSREQARAVTEAYRRRGAYFKGAEVAWNARSASSLFELANAALAKGDRDSTVRLLRCSVFLLPGNRDWEMMASIIGDRNSQPGRRSGDREMRRVILDQGDSLRCIIVRGLARTSALADAPIQMRDSFQYFLRDFLRVKASDPVWRRYVTPQEAGAALERAGRIIDALSFYEAIESGHSHPGIKDFAHLRWIRSKERQAQYLREHGDEIKAANIEHDLRNDARAKDVDTLDEYPLLAPVTFTELWSDPAQQPSFEPPEAESQPATPAAQHLDGTESLQIEGFKFEFSPTARRCNVTNTTTMEQAFLKLATRKCGGEVEFREDSGRFICDDWGLTVWFDPEPVDGCTIELHSNQRRIHFGAGPSSARAAAQTGD